MSKLLQWQELYCFQKILPILTRWQLFNYSQGNQNIPMRGVVWPDFIKKKRAPKGTCPVVYLFNQFQLLIVPKFTC